MNDYAESMFGAIDLIVQERMKDLQFDKTIVCTINENKGDGLYSVSEEGGAQYDVYSDIMSYPVGMQVNVLIPQGDYNNQKTITGRYISNTGEITDIRYMTPFDNCLDITGNIAIPHQEGSLLANDPDQREILIWEKSYSSDVDGFTRMGVSADFYAALAEFEPIAGSYGLHINIEHETIDGSVPIKHLYLDSSDMYGNPYLFDAYFNQQKIFDISNMRNISSIKISFYQNCDFKKLTSSESNQEESIPYQYKNLQDIFEKFINNLKVKNLYVFFGYDVNAFDKDTVLLFSIDSLKYNVVGVEEKPKRLQVRWIRVDGKQKYVVEQTDLTESNRIHWYRYNKETEPDLIAGDNWEELKIPGYERHMMIDYEPLLTVNSQKLKVVITENETMDDSFSKQEEARNCKKFESNELEFISATNLPDKRTQGVVDGLKIKILNDTYDGNYRIYSENGGFIKRASETNVEKKLVPVLTLDGKEIALEKIKKEISVKWKIPNKASMIKLISVSNSTDGAKSIVNNYEAVYKIANRYNSNHINNTIECEVIYKGNTYTASRDLFFGITGTHGTDYTFVIESSIDAYTRLDMEQFTLTAKVYDHNDEEIDPATLGTETIKWSWYHDDDTNTKHLFSFVEQEGISIHMKPAEDANTAGFNGRYFNIVQAEITLKTTYIPYNQTKEKTRSVKMKALYAIPLRRENNTFMNGPTKIVYNSSGQIAYRQNDLKYELVGIQNSYSDYDISWEIRVNKDSNNNTESISPYLPTIQIKKNTNGTRDYYLSTKSLFIKDLPKDIIVICIAKHKKDSNKESLALWVQPLIIWQDQWESGLLNQWDGSLTIDEKNGIILSAMMGAGIKNSNNTFSGVLMGDVGSSAGLNNSPIGLYGFYEGTQSFGFKVDGTAFIGRSGIGRIEFDGNSGIIQSATFNDNKGMQINLTEGIIKAHQFTIDARNGKKYIHFSNVSPYFQINAPNTNNNEKTLIYIADDGYYLQSKDFDSAGIEDRLTGGQFKIDLQNGSFEMKGFCLITHEGDNRFVINEYADDYPVEVAHDKGAVGVRLGWDGVVDIGEFDNKHVSLTHDGSGGLKISGGLESSGDVITTYTKDGKTYNYSVNDIATRLATLEASVGTSADAAKADGSVYARIKQIVADLGIQGSEIDTLTYNYSIHKHEFSGSDTIDLGIMGSHTVSISGDTKTPKNKK